MEMTEYLILPGCDDMNRGDQALIWETVNLAKDAGFSGDYYMMASEEHSKQSALNGIGCFGCILQHPSAHFKNMDNMHYTTTLKVKWGFAAIYDMIVALPLLNPLIRKIIQPFYSREMKDTLAHYERAKASFVKGGGFLHANGGLEESYKIFYFLYHINLALSFSHTVYIMPNSFGPFEAPFVKRMIHNTLSRCKIVTTRESISNGMLKAQCKIDAINMPDLAFYLKHDHKEEISRNLQQSGIPIGKKKCVAITVRPFRFLGEEDPEGIFNKYIQGISDFVEWLDEHDYYPVFVEHVSDALSHEDDMTAIKEVRGRIPSHVQYGVFSNKDYDCEEMKSVYSCFDFTVGTRFHSVIFSLSENVPSIAMTYGGNKGQGIMKDLGLQQYAIDMKDIDGEALISRFRILVENEQHIRQKLEDMKQLMINKRNDLVHRMEKCK